MANQLSPLDYPQVLKDAHRQEEHALAVVDARDWVPGGFSKLSYEYLTTGPATGEVSKVTYFNNGTQLITEIGFRDDYLGTAELTSFNFTGITPATLSGKHFFIYDNVGSVGVWFDVDNLSTPPITGALRDLEIDIATGDTAAQIALKFKLAMDADAQFIAVVSGINAVVSAIQVGERLDAFDINTSLVLSSTSGTYANTLNNKYFFINSAGDVTEYYVWYNVAGGGTDPAIVGKTGLMVSLSSGANKNTVATAVKSVLESTLDFEVAISGSVLTITTVLPGVTTPTLDFNSTPPLLQTTQVGADRGVVAIVNLTYDVSGNLVTIERI